MGDDNVMVGDNLALGRVMCCAIQPDKDMNNLCMISCPTYTYLSINSFQYHR